MIEVLVAVVGAFAMIVVSLIENRTTVKTLNQKIEASHKANAELQEKLEKKKAEELMLLKKGVQAVLRAQMIDDWNKWSAEGFAPLYVKENFENCWKCYHSLGENGVMNGIHIKFMALPTTPRKKGESK